MEKKTNMKLSMRLLVLLSLMGLGLIAASVVSALVLLGHTNLLAVLTVQDVLAFIIPAVAAMAIFYRRPLHAMCLDRGPGWLAILVIIMFYIVSLPAMNWLVDLNEQLSLPEALSDIEQWMRAAEDEALATTQTILDIHTVGELLACLLVVGLMAGLSEEMLFRGAMQRTMQDSRLSTHAVVWTVAIIFSAMHLQFYGFLPRMVLGVWLGYLLVWTRSLWAPIIAHTLNNSTVVVFSYLTNLGLVPEGYGDNLGLPSPGAFPWLAVVSLAVSLAIAIITHRHYQRRVKGLED